MSDDIITQANSLIRDSIRDSHNPECFFIHPETFEEFMKQQPYLHHERFEEFMKQQLYLMQHNLSADDCPTLLGVKIVLDENTPKGKLYLDVSLPLCFFRGWGDIGQQMPMHISQKGKLC